MVGWKPFSRYEREEVGNREGRDGEKKRLGVR